MTSEPKQHELKPLQSEADWNIYHRIREDILWKGRGLQTPYNRNHPDEYKPEFEPLLLLFKGNPIGTVRVDKTSNGLGIRLVAIEADVQRRGHGSALMTLIEERAVTSGITILEVNSAKESVGFWEAVGYSLIDDAHREFTLLRKQLSS